MNKERRTEIQWLRGLAATEVVFCHSDLVTKHFTDFRVTGLDWYYPYSGLGVEVFFMVSGYVICMRAASHPTGGAFFLSRVRRLFPMYWIFTSLVLLTFAINPGWRLNNFEMTPWSLLHSYLILPQTSFPILGVGWTLEHEMLFYAFVALIMAFWSMNGPAKFILPWLLAGVGLVGCLYGFPGAGQVDPAVATSPWITHFLSPYMLAFGFGWLVRCAEEMRPAAGIWSVSLYVGIGVIGYLVSTGFATQLELRIGLAALIFGGFILCRRLFEADTLLNRLGWKFGDASFAIYLSHWFVLSALGKVLGVIDPPSEASGLVRVAAIAICIVVGYVIYMLLERPLDRWLRGRGTPAASKPAGGGGGVLALLRGRLRPTAQTTQGAQSPLR
ncbi:acyltransferase [Hyphomicrobium sp.]|uniref:acyltransferase family protein n=1 Tax=Hyphomicrobium sp. TaxID=82 RepID=UPI0025B80EB4|nr:acyltransferase [Hyphomicrobium sp.]MCC7250784.1 acyltransferase [Hyphomicrobium sp.]